MADLSDDELAAIVRANEHPDCCRFIPRRAMRAAIAADRALNAPQAAPVAQAERAGWVLVPVEPTQEMLDQIFPAGRLVADAMYRAMLAAAPTPDQTKG